MPYQDDPSDFQSSAGERQPAIRRAFDLIHKSQESQLSLIERLEERLRPVSSSAPTCGEPTSAVTDACCEFHGDMMNIECVMTGCNERIEQILRQLEI